MVFLSLPQANAGIASFQIRSHSLFTDHPKIWSYIICATASAVERTVNK
jgi:hypothetical protein